MAQSNEKSSNYGIISFMKARVSRRKEGLSSSSVHCAFSAITVGSGRAAEPYIIAFHYKSDNVAGKPLGTLFGFFEVEVHDEDAAYIVNFLASVAKKEYFTNPRREVNESFETTLHKINVALAELAKEGNVCLLGHLHGILGAVSEGTVHFSATGDGVLALVRENSLRPISDGLAEVTSEPHPLKTFTEVSSGHKFSSLRHCEGGALPPEAISNRESGIASSGYRPPRNDGVVVMPKPPLYKTPLRRL